jgi:ankyrin repeat protein
MHGLMRLAALTGISHVIRTRLAAGDNVNATDPQGRTALMLAARRGHLEACRSLLEAKADALCISDAGETALSLATTAGYNDIVRLLHDHTLPATRPISEPIDRDEDWSEAYLELPAIPAGRARRLSTEEAALVATPARQSLIAVIANRIGERLDLASIWTCLSPGNCWNRPGSGILKSITCCISPSRAA